LDENNISDEELLSVPAPAPFEETMQSRILAATATISQFDRPSDFTELDMEDCYKLIKSLFRGTKFSSTRSALKIYTFICRGLGISDSGTREELYARLTEWACLNFACDFFFRN
jgi:hypothetical protein